MRSEASEYNDCRPNKRAFDGDVRRGRERPSQAASALRSCDLDLDLDLVVSSGCWWPRPKSPLDIAPPYSNHPHEFYPYIGTAYRQRLNLLRHRRCPALGRYASFVGCG
jgi:hypothetical protein